MSRREQPAANLKAVAERVGLAPCSVSSVLNNAPAAQAIPQSTKERIFQAAAELNYRPNLWARSLRTKRTRMVAAIAPDFGHPAAARVIAAAQKRLQRKGYLLVLVHLDSAERPYLHAQFQQRGIEGVIAVALALPTQLDLPVATVDLEGLTLSGFAEENVQSWLSELGISAAESVIRHIETGASLGSGGRRAEDTTILRSEGGIESKFFSALSANPSRALRLHRPVRPRNAAEKAEA